MKFNIFTPTIALTIDPFTSEIYIDRTVRRTNRQDKPTILKVSLPKTFGTAIFINLTNLRKKS